MKKKHALILGGLGVIGRNLVEHFSNLNDWEVTAISRRKPDFKTSANFHSVDLNNMDEIKAKLSHLKSVTHIFFAAYQEHSDQSLQIEKNLQMLSNIVKFVEVNSISLERVILFEGAKYYGAHLGAFKTPAKEDDPRQMPPLFYYDQEDWLRAQSHNKNWDMIVLRPDVVCGFAIGNPMNLAMVIAVYATISKELGLPFRFPGSKECYSKLAQVTESKQLSKGAEWASTLAKGSNAYNLTNGDLFRWNEVWKKIAKYFEMELDEPMPISLTEMMKDKEELWQNIRKKYDLINIPYKDIASWGFGDFIFNCNWDVISSVTKIREAGFHSTVDSEYMFIRLFDEFRERKVIP